MCNLHKFFNIFLDINGVMTTLKRRILLFVFTILTFNMNNMNNYNNNNYNNNKQLFFQRATHDNKTDKLVTVK